LLARLIFNVTPYRAYRINLQYAIAIILVGWGRRDWGRRGGRRGGGKMGGEGGAGGRKRGTEISL
jgi:hypothetical protein